ncbi:phage tail protein, partial [Pseudomonas sp. NPDC098747]|uniref:phage tail-collar fiber domain-containing protein n=1 Tax=Pseudomonas sp. NPDC098747 TaxID=3364487 RepID=UPI00383AC08E
MIDQNSLFFAILTAVGEAKHANAIALGLDWRFTHMGIGDANGTNPIPDRLQTQLINEWRRAPINQIRVDSTQPNVVITEQVIPTDVGGKWIREIGLYDVDGDLVAVANCAPSYKPLLSQGTGKTQVVRMNFIVSSSANIELKIDPSVVLATREYVDWKIQEELAKLDHKHSVQYATTGAIALTGLEVQAGGDWAATLPAGARVLVKDQAAGQDNGLYSAAAGTWTRTSDADRNAEVTSGLLVLVEQGTTLADTVWQLMTDSPITLNTTNLQFEMIAGHDIVVDALSASQNLADVDDVAASRSNLGLGSAAIHTVGIEENQIPDMVSRLGLGGWGYGEQAPLVQTIDFDTFAARHGEMVHVSSACTNGPPNLLGNTTATAEFFNGATGCVHQRVTFTDDAGVGYEGQVWQRVRSHPSQPWGAWAEITVAQATETVLGTIRIASDAEVDVGTSDLTVVTPLNLGRKLASKLTTTLHLGDTINLNTLGAYGQEGVYYQSSDALAVPDRGYPVGKSGTLLVTPSAYGLQQEYTTYAGEKFCRGLTATFDGTGPWGPWIEVTVSPATEAAPGTIRIASDAQVDAGASDASAITPLKLKNKTQASLLDATAGRLMQVGAFGMGASSALISNTDLNDQDTTGFYFGEQLVGAPDVGWHHVISLIHNDSYRLQILSPFHGTGLYYR